MAMRPHASGTRKIFSLLPVCGAAFALFSVTIFADDLGNVGKPLERIERLIQEGDKKKAFEILSALILKSPGNVDALLAHGRLALELERPRDAVLSCDAICG